MPDAIPACFRGRVAGGPPASTAAGPTLTTSLYDTHLGLAALTWSRTVLGLSLSAELRLSGRPPGDQDDLEALRIRVRPWLFWKRRGSKQFHLQGGRRRRAVEVAWDLTRARFPDGGGLEPCAGFFVAVAVDDEMLLVAGDLGDEACKRMKAAKPKQVMCSPVLISRREHVVMAEASNGGGGGRKHRTVARFGGKEREISIELGGGEERWDSGMSVAVDGRQVLQVRRLRWKFRGSEEVEVEGGARVQFFWDLHNWMFRQAKDGATAAPAPPELGSAAVFMFRIEREAGGEEAAVKGADFSRALVYGGVPGLFGKSHQNYWSESSSCGDGGSVRGKGRRKTLVETSSFSSSSSASSASSSTVMGWASPEEAKLRSADCFSLLVYAWKS